MVGSVVEAVATVGSKVEAGCPEAEMDAGFGDLLEIQTLPQLRHRRLRARRHRR